MLWLLRSVEVDLVHEAVSDVVLAGEVCVHPRDEAALGAVVSKTMALLAPRDPAAPGVAKVRVASLVAESLMVPPARARAEVDA